MILYILLIFLLILYIFLLQNFLKTKKYTSKIILSLSVSILFIYLYHNIKINEGYAVLDSLPKSFYVLNSYIYNDHVLLLIKEKDSKPRLYKVKKSIELNRFLNKYNNLRRDGQDVIIKKDNTSAKDSLGMHMETIQKKLPQKEVIELRVLFC